LEGVPSMALASAIAISGAVPSTTTPVPSPFGET
jgi:hypothetical protein